MRNQDAIERFDILRDGRQSRLDFLAAQAGIDKDARAFGGDERGIPRAAAG